MDGKRGFTTFSSHERGFTLIELLIVIVVLGVLATVVLIAINPLGMINSANLAKTKTFSASVENLLSISQVGKWSFEDSTKLDKDTSGYGNNGTVSLVTQQTSSTCGLGFGACASFNGTTSYISINDSPSLKPTSAITISAWVKPTNFTCKGDDTNCDIITKYQVYQGYTLEITSAGKPYLTIAALPSTWNTATSAVSIKAGEWSHIVGTWDSSSGAMKIYVDGNQSGAGTSASISHNTSAAFIGRASWHDGDYFNGLIDEVQIYSQALLSSQIQQLYAQGLERHQLVYNK